MWTADFPRMYLQDDHQRLLAQAGFRAVSFYGSYDLAPYDKGTSRRLIVVAEK